MIDTIKEIKPNVADENVSKNIIDIFRQSVETQKKAEAIMTANKNMLESVKDILYAKIYDLIQQLDAIYEPVIEAVPGVIADNYTSRYAEKNGVYIYTYRHGEPSRTFTIEYDSNEIAVNPIITITPQKICYSHPNISKDIEYFIKLLANYDTYSDMFKSSFCESIMYLAKNALKKATDNLEKENEHKVILSKAIRQNGLENQDIQCVK